MAVATGTEKPQTGAVALTVEDLVVEFDVGKGQTVHAVSGITFTVGPGETLGVVGESGCGKSTAGRAIMQLPSPTSGSIRLGGMEMTELDAEALRRSRTQLQMIFQDPISSLNPRRKVKALVTEGPAIWGGKDKRSIEARAREVLAEVGLDPDVVWDRTPRELSGGQCQRVCIARALMLDPRVLICDEPVSSLDVSVQAQILNLLEDTKKRHGLSLLFIAHNMAVVKNISDRVMIMYLGRICEIVPAEGMQKRSLHPYTQLLLASIPDPDAEVTASQNLEQRAVELPSPLDPPSGCRFRTRCPLATARCAEEVPDLRLVGEGHQVACHNV